ncbi:MAG: 30S ribosomal protein S8 [Magnetococcales bacterium]|nr:30S ribosomal protein S8 [Magnetococcales bacterium]MEC8067968.1 30S ribosomal protein S8 [Pseudomonadota bacterium]
MTMTDPIADMLSRIRNGLQAKKKFVEVPTSKVKRSILNVLSEEGYIRGFSDVEGAKFPTLSVELKYSGGRSVISEISRYSRPGLRQYSKSKEIPTVANGLGVVVVSTSQGVMTDTQAKEQNLGGELLCKVF